MHAMLPERKRHISQALSMTSMAGDISANAKRQKCLSHAADHDSPAWAR